MVLCAYGALTCVTLGYFQEKAIRMSNEMTALQEQFGRLQATVESAKTLLADLKSRLDSAIADGDSAAAAELGQRVQALTDSLAAVITANTVS